MSNPTPEEIKERAAEIRRGWSEEEEISRFAIKPTELITRICRSTVQEPTDGE